MILWFICYIQWYLWCSWMLLVILWFHLWSFAFLCIYTMSTNIYAMSTACRFFDISLHSSFGKIAFHALNFDAAKEIPLCRNNLISALITEGIYSLCLALFGVVWLNKDEYRLLLIISLIFSSPKQFEHRFVPLHFFSFIINTYSDFLNSLWGHSLSMKTGLWRWEYFIVVA